MPAQDARIRPTASLLGANLEPANVSEDDMLHTRVSRTDPLRNERSYKWAVPKGTFLLRVEEVFERLSLEDDPISRISTIGDFLLTMPSVYPVLPSDAGVGAATVLQERAAELERVFGSCLGWMAPGVSLRKLPHHQLETNPVRVAARIFHLMALYIATAAATEPGDISLKT